METVSNDIICHITLFLDARSVCRLECVSKRFRNVLKESEWKEIVWKRMCGFVVIRKTLELEGPKELIVRKEEKERIGGWKGVFKELIETKYQPFSFSSSMKQIHISEDCLSIRSTCKKGSDRMIFASPAFKEGAWVVVRPYPTTNPEIMMLLQPKFFLF